MTKTSRQDDNVAFRKYLSECKVDPQGRITHASETVGDTDSMLSQIESPTVTDAEWIAELKSQIEALSDGAVMWSRNALTNRRTPHKQFINGAEVHEHRDGGDTIWSSMPLGELITAQRVAITRYRESIEGPVDLVWRREPEIRRSDKGVSLYTRLCFEPSIIEVSKGIWVNVELSDTCR